MKMIISCSLLALASLSTTSFAADMHPTGKVSEQVQNCEDGGSSCGNAIKSRAQQCESEEGCVSRYN